MLPIVGIGAIYLRHRRLPRELAPSPLTTAALWVTTAVIVCPDGLLRAADGDGVTGSKVLKF